MGLEYSLIHLAKKNDYDNVQEYEIIYRIHVIKEICALLQSKGYNLNSMLVSDIKGRHVNILMHYWGSNSINQTVLYQKYSVVAWWCNVAKNSAILKPVSVYVPAPEYIKSKNNFDHILLPTTFCFECHIQTEFINQRSQYVCPTCNASIGVHRGNNAPLGGLANLALKSDRKLAHSYFDPLWQRKLAITPNITKSQARRMGYKWLSNELNIPQKLSHIAFFNSHLCKQVVEACKPYHK
ncbi:DUF3268 family zinc-finger domain-containing protein [Acinetobacter indicus]|uniref:zinc-finger-containing protein n=1 Tax=Acinetobacter TaxID=469 RepID=UPI0015D3C54C|nr:MULTISPECIES: zinc-finger-containing protein [Acinetobacter]MCP0917703.1 DUF3268 family zinc-finger domain-containing protein [Acinetobacter indicus]